MSNAIVSLVRKRNAIIPPHIKEEQKEVVQMQSYTDEIVESKHNTSQSKSSSRPLSPNNQVGRKGLDTEMQKRIYEMSKDGKNATDIKNALGISYITARKYMSAKAVRGEKVKEKSVQKNRKRLTAQTPVHEKLHFTAPVAEMNQLELALNVLRLSKEWKVSFSDICEAANVAQRIRDAVK